jgi:hypothetical protein
MWKVADIFRRHGATCSGVSIFAASQLRAMQDIWPVGRLTWRPLKQCDHCGPAGLCLSLLPSPLSQMSW